MNTTESDRAFAAWFADSFGYSADAEATDGEIAAWSAAVEWATRRTADELRIYAKAIRRGEDVGGRAVANVTPEVLLGLIADRLAAGPTPQPAKE